MMGLLELPATTSGYYRVQPVSDTSALGDEGLVSSRRLSADAWEKRFREIEAIHLLKDDWDGDGAVAPHPSVIASAHELLRTLRALSLPCPTGVGAGPNGTVLIDWRNGRRYFEIDVVAPAKAEWLGREPGTATQSGVIRAPLDPRTLNALLWVMAG